MNREEIPPHFIKIVLGLWVVIISAGTIFYPLQEYTNLEKQLLYPVSLVIGLIVSCFIMYYLIKLHHMIHHMIFKQKVKPINPSFYGSILD